MWLSLYIHFTSSEALLPLSLDVVLLFSLQTLRLYAGGHRGAEIPVPIPNTEVKRPIAEGSAGPARARVGRRRPFFCPRSSDRKRGPRPLALEIAPIVPAFFCTPQSRRHPADAPPLARPSGSASPRGIRRPFFLYSNISNFLGLGSRRGVEQSPRGLGYEVLGLGGVKS